MHKNEKSTEDSRTWEQERRGKQVTGKKHRWETHIAYSSSTDTCEKKDEYWFNFSFNEKVRQYGPWSIFSWSQQLQILVHLNKAPASSAKLPDSLSFMSLPLSPHAFSPNSSLCLLPSCSFFSFRGYVYHAWCALKWVNKVIFKWIAGSKEYKVLRKINTQVKYSYLKNLLEFSNQLFVLC